MKIIFTAILILTWFAGAAFAQKENIKKPNWNAEPLPESVPLTKEIFTGFHGYYLTSAELIPVKQKLFRELISNETIPIAELNPGFVLAWFSFMRNWMYTGMSYSYAFSNEEKTDSLISRLEQYSVTGRFGYNMIKTPIVVVSPYVGLRYTKFSHLTSLRGRRISLDDYLQVRDIDLRVSQYSGEMGINTTFSIKKRWSFGLYAAYLLDFSNHPIVRTRENRVQYKINNPLNNFVLGLGFGTGINDFRKKIIHPDTTKKI
jgi:hypothetical protein